MKLYSVFIVLQFIYFIHIILYYFFWKKAIKNQTVNYTAIQNKFISIIIVARNEEAYIENCIKSILAQSYDSKNWELIIVDDFSEDNTVYIAYNYISDKIHLIELKKILPAENAFTANKKTAITHAIQIAKGEIIACTDADCEVGETWLQLINDSFQNEKIQFVTGPVLFKNNNTLLDKFQIVDMYSLIGITCATIQMEKPYMCNGANLAYRKNTFISCNGFDGIDKLATGDDVLLMHKIHARFGKNSINYLNTKSAIVYTHTEETLSGLYHQRTRWVSKTTSYNSIFILFTAIFMYCYHTAILFLPLLLLYFHQSFYIFIYCFGAKLFLDAFFIHKISKHFDKKYNVLLMPIFELVYMIYVCVIGLSAIVGRYTWKNRKLKSKY
jgi:glycosyltransferase involved in cell wall biosynthesis